MEDFGLLDFLWRAREEPRSSLSTGQLATVPCEADASCTPLTPIPRLRRPLLARQLIVRSYSELVDFINARELPFARHHHYFLRGIREGIMRLDQLPSFLPYVRSVFPSSDFSFNDYLSDLRILARPFRRAEYLPVSFEIFVPLSILESK